MRDPVARRDDAVCGTRALDGIHRDPHRSIPDGMNVQIEARKVKSTRKFENHRAVMLQLAAPDSALARMVSVRLLKVPNRAVRLVLAGFPRTCEQIAELVST